MSFKDYPPVPASVQQVGDNLFIGPNMARNNVRRALQQFAADGRELWDLNLQGMAQVYDSVLEGENQTTAGEVFGVVGDASLSYYKRGANGSELIYTSPTSAGLVAAIQPYSDAAVDAAESAVTAQGIAEQAASDALEAAGVTQSALLTTRGFYPGARSFVPQGLKSVAIGAAGSGGTNGTYVVPLAGSNLTVAAFVNVTVAGGAVTAVSVNASGLYIGGSLTIGTVNLSTITGLTGATVTPTGGYLINSGEYYYTDHASDPDQASRFQNQSNVAVEVDASVDYLNIALARGYAEDTAAALPAVRFGISDNLMNDATLLVVPVAGAVTSTELGQDIGLVIPVGQDGQGSLIRARYEIDGAKYAGWTIQLRLAANLTPAFTRDAKLYMQRSLADGSDSVGVAPTTITDTSGSGKRLAVWNYVVNTLDRAMEPYLQFQNATNVAGTDESIVLTDFSWSFIAEPAGAVQSAADQNLAVSNARLLSSAAIISSGALSNRIITVAPSGADFTHPKLACDALTGASISKPYAVMIAAGTYSGYGNWCPPDYVDLIGEDPLTTIISLSLANNAAPIDIQETATIYGVSNSLFKNLTFAVTNGRYALHIDTPTTTDYRMRFENCIAKHLGNEGARQYQIGLGRDPDAGNSVSDNPYHIWENTNACGHGMSSGSALEFYASVLFGPSCGIGFHDNVDFTKPAKVSLIGCKAFTTDLARAGAVQVAPFASGKQGLLEIIGSDVDGIAHLGSSDSIKTVGYGNKPSPFRVDGAQTFRPFISDEEGSFLNDTGSSIPRKTVLAWDSSQRKVRPMTSADAASLYAGVAWEAIADGAFGRVKTSGALPSEDLLLDGTVTVSALTFGQAFSIKSGTPGTLVAGGTQGLLRVTDPAQGAPLGFYSATHQVAL